MTKTKICTTNMHTNKQQADDLYKLIPNSRRQLASRRSNMAAYPNTQTTFLPESQLCVLTINWPSQGPLMEGEPGVENMAPTTLSIRHHFSYQNQIDLPIFRPSPSPGNKSHWTRVRYLSAPVNAPSLPPALSSGNVCVCVACPHTQQVEQLTEMYVQTNMQSAFFS